jgi:predicted O-linked N-acetylglucosamine transferase (SPINDLY family)
MFSSIDEELKRALSLQQRGHIAEAVKIYKAILRNELRNPIANHNLGVIEAIHGNREIAIRLLATAVDESPRCPEFWISYIETLIANQEIRKARKELKKATKEGISKSSIKSLKKKLTSQGSADTQKTNTTTIAPSTSKKNEILNYFNSGDLHTSLELAISVTKQYPKDPFAWKVRAFTYQSLGRLEDALDSVQKAFELDDTDPAIVAQYGNILLRQGKYEQSIPFFEKSIKIAPNEIAAYANLGNALKQRGDLEQAKVVLKQSLSLSSKSYNAYNTLAVVCIDLHEISEAEKYLRKAIKIFPEFAEAHNNLGSVFKEQNKLKEAERCFLKAIKINPNYPSPLYNLGTILEQSKQYERALDYYEQAYSLSPALDYLLGSMVHLRMRLAIWTSYNEDIAQIASGIVDGRKICTAFTIQSLVDDPKVQLLSSQTYWDSCCKSNTLKIEEFGACSHHKIRVGYFSPDFHDHPVAHLTAELFKLHNRNYFEIYAFSLGAKTRDNYTDRIRSNVDHFIEITELSDAEIVSHARLLEIDIAVDLAGFTKNCRPNIFASGVAPVQIGYIGFLGSMGSESYDFIISEKTIIPEEHKKYYKEKIVYLPTYQVNDPNPVSIDSSLDADYFSIPTGVFVFCCFNDTYKISPETFASWGRILRNVPASVLMIYCNSETARLNLKKEMVNLGIDPSRLLVSNFLDRSKYLARYKYVDLFLDTLPYNSGATASDALRMGVPIITRIGNCFASRMCASLLNSVNMSELVTSTAAQYEDLAIELANDTEKLIQIKQRLSATTTSTKLFDAKFFTRNLESAFIEMKEQYLSKNPFTDIYINADSEIQKLG